MAFLVSAVKLFTLIFCIAEIYGYDTDWVSSYCPGSKSRWVYASGKNFKMSTGDWPRSGCTMKYTASGGSHTYHLYLDILDFYVPCSSGSIDIIDSNGVDIASGLCDFGPSQTQYKSNSDSISIRINRKSSSFSAHFNIMLNRYYRESFTFECGGTEFDCDNGRCIDYALQCDGWDNCGDNSDETRDCTWRWSVSVKAGVGFAVVFGIIIVAAVIVGGVRRRRYGAITYERHHGCNAPCTTTVTTVGSSQYGVTPGLYSPPPAYGAPAQPPPYPTTY